MLGLYYDGLQLEKDIHQQGEAMKTEVQSMLKTDIDFLCARWLKYILVLTLSTAALLTFCSGNPAACPRWGHIDSHLV